MEGGWLAVSASIRTWVGKESIALHMSSTRKSEQGKSLLYPHWLFGKTHTETYVKDACTLLCRQHEWNL